MNFQKICVLGLGYIGLPTASIFATKGRKVLGVDVVERVVRTINDGGIHIEEPDLDILVKAAVQSGNLKAAVAPAVAVDVLEHVAGEGGVLRRAEVHAIHIGRNGDLPPGGVAALVPPATDDLPDRVIAGGERQGVPPGGVGDVRRLVYGESRPW